jgi:hypothetical protein
VSDAGRSRRSYRNGRASAVAWSLLPVYTRERERERESERERARGGGGGQRQSCIRKKNILGPDLGRELRTCWSSWGDELPLHVEVGGVES